MIQKSWSQASLYALRVTTRLQRESHGSQDGGQGQRALLTSQLFQGWFISCFFLKDTGFLNCPSEQ